jgi:hypothetical protein
MARFVGSLLIIAMVLALVGCGGGDGGENPPEPASNTATIRGYVVQSDDAVTPAAGATVREATTGQSVLTSSTGWFSLSGLPETQATITVEAPDAVGFQGTALTVPTRARKATDVVATLLPADAATPTAVSLQPQTPSVEVGGTLAMAARVTAGATELDLLPSWVLYYGDQPAPAALGPQGLLTAVAAGSASVTAIVGGLSASTTVTVRAEGAPEITSVLLSRSAGNPVPASGGTVTLTAAVNDGDGVAIADAAGNDAYSWFEIITPAGDTEKVYLGAPDAGDVKDGTWNRTFAVPANSNVPGSDGVQATELYSVRVVARDRAGRTARSIYQDFLVEGVDPPPAQP